jgi:hypothetical protein
LRGHAGELLEVTDAYLLVLCFARVNQRSGTPVGLPLGCKSAVSAVEEAPVAQDGVPVELGEQVRGVTDRR